MAQLHDIEHVPKFRRIASEISRSIRRGDFPAGTRLPDDEILGSQFNVSRNTLIRALCELRDTGLLKRIPGGGTFVNNQDEMSQATSLFFISEGSPLQPTPSNTGTIYEIADHLRDHLDKSYELP